jgi:hypothetical protein
MMIFVSSRPATPGRPSSSGPEEPHAGQLSDLVTGPSAQPQRATEQLLAV